MAKGTLNKVLLIGNVGKEVKYIESGEGVAKLSIATTQVGKDKVDKTEWHNITAFGKLAGIARDYVKKGSKIFVEGRLHINKWTDKEGKERVQPDIIANSIQMLSPKKDDNLILETTAPNSFDDQDIPF